MGMLFHAQFKDGSYITQNDRDESVLTEGRNCYFDVLQRIDEVEVFSLKAQGRPFLSVRLTDGKFGTLGLYEFIAHDPTIVFPPDTKYTLLYQKHVVHHFNGPSRVGGEVRHEMGWKATDVDGKEHRVSITVTD